MPKSLLGIFWKKKKTKPKKPAALLLCFFNEPQASELSDKSIMELELQDFHSFTSVLFSAACL